MLTVVLASVYTQSRMLVNIIHTYNTHTHKRRESEEMMSRVDVMVFCPVSSSGIKVSSSPDAESSGSWLQESLCRSFPQPECLVLAVSLWWLVGQHIYVSRRMRRGAQEPGSLMPAPKPPL